MRCDFGFGRYEEELRLLYEIENDWKRRASLSLQTSLCRAQRLGYGVWRVLEGSSRGDTH